jgi:hypothetical protein
MGSFGLAEAAEAIRKRVGSDARYSSFVPPRPDDVPPAARRGPQLLRLLWTAALLLLIVVLVLAVLVALGF